MRMATLPDDPDGRVTEMFARVVPEIASGTVTIRALARIPGVRTKIAVESSDPDVDPLSACVGWQGSRIKTVVAELSGERVDVMPWSSFPDRLIRIALAPLHVVRMTLDAESRRAVVVARDPFNPTMPTADRWRSDAERRELASRISGWEIGLTVEVDDAG